MSKNVGRSVISEERIKKLCKELTEWIEERNLVAAEEVLLMHYWNCRIMEHFINPLKVFVHEI